MRDRLKRLEEWGEERVQRLARELKAQAHIDIGAQITEAERWAELERSFGRQFRPRRRA
ncbi:MAG TPA: hypothetical protein VI756_25765 [Blastocatellia bacterium]